MIDGMVGLEDDAEPEAFVDCAAEIASCRANCCTYVFALTREEVNKGFFKYSAERPYYMARDADGYCPYLDRKTFQCSIHEKRLPLPRPRNLAMPHPRKTATALQKIYMLCGKRAITTRQTKKAQFSLSLSVFLIRQRPTFP